MIAEEIIICVLMAVLIVFCIAPLLMSHGRKNGIVK